MTSSSTTKIGAALTLVTLVMVAAASAQTSSAVVLDAVRIIVGDGSPALEHSALLLHGGRIVAVGRAGTLKAPAGARRLELTGKTVMPALIDGHTHLGFTNVRTMTTSAATYSRDTLADHLRRYAYYGIAATLSLGADAGDAGFQVRSMPAPGAALFRLAGRGIAWPGSGPQAAHNRDTPHNITTEAEARAAVREEAAKHVDIIKIWVDDRGGTAKKLTPALYTATIEEAHARKLRVVAHIFSLEDAKGLLKAGVDGFAHGIRDTDVDDEVMTLFKARPQVFLIPNLPNSGEPQDVDWAADSLPPQELKRLKDEQATRKPEATKALKTAFGIQARNLAKLSAAGVRIAFGTDAGESVGFTAHQELEDMVLAGMTPGRVLTAATSTTAGILPLRQAGTLARGMSADLLVLDANPLDDIRNTRRIAAVFLRGLEVDRAALRAEWAAK